MVGEVLSHRAEIDDKSVQVERRVDDVIVSMRRAFKHLRL